MNQLKWKPIVKLEDVAHRLNRIFHPAPIRYVSDSELLNIADWTPTVDIGETTNSYLIRAEIPGVRKKDVMVILQSDMLTIQGERKIEDEINFHCIERCYGNFSRSFEIPNDADQNDIRAEVKDGMLNITLGKTLKKRPKSIEISTS